MVDALRRIEAASRTIGIKAVVLDAIDDGGAEAFMRRMRFYGQLGFVSFPSRPARMFIAMATVRAALGGGGRRNSCKNRPAPPVGSARHGPSIPTDRGGTATNESSSRPIAISRRLKT